MWFFIHLGVKFTGSSQLNKYSGDIEQGKSSILVLQDLKKATKDYTAEAVKRALAESSLNEEQVKQILSGKGLKGELLETATAEITAAQNAKKMAESEGIAAVFTKNLKNALRGLGSTLKSVFVFLATNPIGWIIDGVAALVVFTKLYSKFTTSANEANEAASNSLETSKNNVKTVNQQKDSVDKLTESYEKLSKGVNTATNENLTLSTDDYKEYLDTCNQIADMYPELVTGYDAQGNAILSLKGNVQGLTDAYKEAQQEAYKTAFVGVEDEDGKTSGGISDVEKQVSYATNGYDPGDNWWNRAKLTTNRRIEQLKELQDMSLEEIKRSGYTYSVALEDSGININDLLNATEDQLPEYKAKINDFTQTLIQTQTEAVSNAKSSLEGYMKGITDVSGNALASGYDKLTEEQQNFATSLLSSLDLDTLQSFEDSGDFEGAAKKWVDNLVHWIINNCYIKLMILQLR